MNENSEYVYEGKKGQKVKIAITYKCKEFKKVWSKTSIGFINAP